MRVGVDESRKEDGVTELIALAGGGSGSRTDLADAVTVDSNAAVDDGGRRDWKDVPRVVPNHEPRSVSSSGAV
jgi:hypothetical protein